MNGNTLIKFEDVSFRYESDSDTPNPLALEHLNLEIKSGEFVAVLGHNGSGKSTVAKLANAIAVPESGKITVAGMDTSDESKEYEIRQNVGVVMQNPDNQIVATIVEEDVAFGPENLGVEPDEIRKRVDESLKAVGMYEYRFHEPHKLSGGQKQRVAIAGIIAMRTRCIILDEPTAMLDPSGRRDVMNVMIKLNKEMGITVVFITHFMEEAIRADRVVIMESGKKAADGTPAEVFANEELINRCGLEMPPAAVLAKKLKDDNIDLGVGILSAEDFIASFERYISGEAVR